MEWTRMGPTARCRREHDNWTSWHCSPFRVQVAVAVFLSALCLVSHSVLVTPQCPGERREVWCATAGRLGCSASQADRRAALHRVIAKARSQIQAGL